MRTAIQASLELRGSLTESNARLGEAQTIASTALDAATRHGTRVEKLVRERDIYLKTTTMQSAKLALIRHAAKVNQNAPSRTKMLVVAALAAAFLNAMASHPKLASHCKAASRSDHVVPYTTLSYYVYGLVSPLTT